MKKSLLALLTVFTLAGCSSTKVVKSDIEYKVFPYVSKTKYDFNLGITPAIDARQVKFVRNNDDYFNKPITKYFDDTLFEEIRSTNAFTTVRPTHQSIGFMPGSLEIQKLKEDKAFNALFLSQINKFNVNIRKLSDEDDSNFVKLTLFNNVTYKIILSDSEAVIFLTTVDATESKVVKLDDNLYKTINEMAILSLKKSMTQAKKEFVDGISTKHNITQ